MLIFILRRLALIVEVLLDPFKPLLQLTRNGLVRSQLVRRLSLLLLDLRSILFAVESFANTHGLTIFDGTFRFHPLKWLGRLLVIHGRLSTLINDGSGGTYQTLPDRIDIISTGCDAF